MTELLMGNEAIALGALHAGVHLVCGYPGTPSTEILETAAKRKSPSVYVEWSINEKAAMEIAAGASLAGARTLVTMKQVGLNVASDPFMSLSYLGIKGGMVVVSADDPGPISSQTEQDTRTFAKFAKVPVLDPSSPEEAYEMMRSAFLLSERWQTPVLLRPTTRVCHGCAAVRWIAPSTPMPPPSGFTKDPRWVIFPKLSYQQHKRIEERNPKIGESFSLSPFNIREASTGAFDVKEADDRKDHPIETAIEGSVEITADVGHGQEKSNAVKTIFTGGICYAYAKEALSLLKAQHLVNLVKIGTPFPFPESFAREILRDQEEILVAEELDPVIEEALLMICGKYGIPAKIRGKHSGDTPASGEYSVELLLSLLAEFLQLPYNPPACRLPALPIRPPVLCAGCPHRGAFYAVKEAMKGQKAVFTGDIGCYTLGNAAPLHMVDTCLCMGADITMAQGIQRMAPDTKCFAFIGDSTFFAAGLTGVANAVYNQSELVLVVLDNATTAMTGHQPHPGTGKTMMGNFAEKLDIARVLSGLGVQTIKKANPFRLAEAKAAVREAACTPGVSAVIFESPCIALIKAPKKLRVDTERCTGCRRCIVQLGCPALSLSEQPSGKRAAEIVESLCYGCDLCAQLCPTNAIVPVTAADTLLSHRPSEGDLT